MKRTTVKSSHLGAALKSAEKQRRQAVYRGVKRAAHRGKAHLVQQTRAEGKVHTGQFRNSWQVRRRGPNSYEVYNDAPHAGVIEFGARPHPVSREGQEAIYEWVRKKLLGVSQSMAEQNAEVESITRGIVNKLRRHGQKGTFLVRRSLPDLVKILKEEVERSLRKAGEQSANKGKAQGKTGGKTARRKKVRWWRNK